MHSNKLRSYLDSASGITGLLPQVERLIELRRVYTKLVPPQLSRSSSIVNYKQQKVVIFADNNAIAAKLRLLSPRLINDFSKNGLEVTGIRLEVQPRPVPDVQPGRKQARLSSAGTESLEALARRLPESRLKQALSRLAAQGEAPGGDPGAADRGPARSTKK